MNPVKKYRDSLLSLLCVVSWFVLVVRIFRSATGDHVFRDFIITCLITTGVGIAGGVILLFFAMVRNRKLKHHFIYNLFGTLNLSIGFTGLSIFASGEGPAPYILTACFVVGVVIYNDIYSRRTIR